MQEQAQTRQLARAPPIHLTTSFVFESSDHAASLFNLERAGHVYSRISNPTNAVLEQRVAALEGGIGAITTASGQAALHLSVATLMGAGSHIVSSSALYGGSHNLLHYTMSRFGIETTFVHPHDIDGWKKRFGLTPNCFSVKQWATQDLMFWIFQPSRRSRMRRVFLY